MSHEAVAWVLNHSATKGTEKLILIGIASHADKYGRNAWPSVETLARYASVDRRNAQRAIASLRDRGHLLIEEQAGGSRKTAARYATNLYEIVGVAEWAGAALGPPLSEPGAALTVARGGADDQSGAADAPPEQSLELSVEPSLTKTAADGVVSLAFDVFWSNYPKSRRGRRRECLALYRKAAAENGLQGLQIEAGLARWVSYWEATKTEEKYIKTSFYWLKERRWEDDPTLSRQNGTGKPSHRYAPGSALHAGATDREGESGVW